MPKPLQGVQGSGMHTHMSLFRGDRNEFYDEEDGYNLSATAKSFMAGLLRHASRSRRSPTRRSTATSDWSPASRRRSTCGGATTAAG